MTLEALKDAQGVGRSMHELAAELYPICRSITGQGVRQTLEILGRHVPLTFHEVLSGTRVFDWTVPREWNIRDAWIKNPRGEKIVSFADSNLHVVNYSTPLRRRMMLRELRAHLFSLPQHPDWIPYRYSHWEESWGFCLSDRLLQSLEDGEYDVCIDSTLADGSLTYGEFFLPGQTSDEVLISSHCCHPSLCNDNLSGIVLAVHLARAIAAEAQPRRYSYRFLWMPGTIGAIVWLSHNESRVGNIKHGLVLTCVGDAGNSTYKKSRRGDAPIDRAVAQVLGESGQPYALQDFSPDGYDQRQYCSPGFDLPVGCLMRTPHGKFPEYHTSADNLEFIRPRSLADSFDKAWAVMDLLEQNRTYVNLNPKCEPRLSKHGVSAAIGAHAQPQAFQMAILWVLNLSDGAHDLLTIARRSGLPFSLVAQGAQLLLNRGLLRIS
jgi:aminopeptidase-like protein